MARPKPLVASPSISPAMTAASRRQARGPGHFGADVATVLNGNGTITAGRFAIAGATSVILSGNNGLIEATGTNGKAIYAEDGDVTVTNSKIIQATALAALPSRPTASPR